MESVKKWLIIGILLNGMYGLKAQDYRRDTVTVIQYLELAAEFADSVEYDSSIFYYQKAIKQFQSLSKNVGDPGFWEQLVVSLNSLGRVQQLIYLLDDAKKNHTEALNIAQHSLGDSHQEVALSYQNLGEVFLLRENYSRAMEYLHKAQSLQEEFLPSDHPHVSSLHTSLGKVHLGQSNYQEALAHFEKALAIDTLESNKDLVTVANIHCKLGITYGQLQDRRKSLYHFDKALAILGNNRIENHPIMADIYMWKGIVISDTVDLDFLMELYQKALTIRLKIFGELHPSVAESYFYIGNYYAFGKRDYDQGQIYYQQALNINTKVLGNRHPKTADILHYKGVAYYHQAEHDLALSHLQKALNIYLEAYEHNTYVVAKCYNNLAAVHVIIKNYDQGLVYYKHAIKIKQNLFDEHHPSLALTYNNIGTVLINQKNYVQAIPYIQKAITIDSAALGATNQRLVFYYTQLGRIHQNLKNFEKAIHYGQRALAILVPSLDVSDSLQIPSLDGIQPNENLMMALRFKAQAHYHKSLEKYSEKDLLTSLDTYELAANELDSIRMGFLSEKSKEIYIPHYYNIYNGTIQTAEELWMATQKPEFLHRIFRVSERSKSNLLTEALHASKAESFAGIPDRLLVQKTELESVIRKYQKDISDEKSKGEKRDSAKIERLESDFFTSHQQLKELVKVLESDYPEYHQLKYNVSVASVSEVQAFLAPGTALIEYFMGSENLYVMTITSDSLWYSRIPQDSTLQEDIQSLILKVNNPGFSAKQRDLATFHQFAKQSYGLYEKILQPALPDNLSQLIIIPDGLLGYVPFELLLTEPISKNTHEADYLSLSYLLKTYRIRYEYSATLLLGNPHTSSRLSKPFAGFAPAYANERGKLLASKSPLREVYRGLEEGFGQLMFNQPEVTKIATAVKGKSFLGEEASEANFKAKAGQFSIIHLAMHTLINDSLPQYSGLAFTQGNDTTEDNFLYASEIYNLPLKAELAVLSACETGKGKLIQGEGIMSLARAFKYTGTPNIVMSLWLVNDKSTEILMTHFYDHLLAGLPKDQALQQAKLDLIADGEFAHPFYWAPFVLVGDDTPLVFSTSWYPYLIGLLLLALSLVVLYYLHQRHKP